VAPDAAEGGVGGDHLRVDRGVTSDAGRGSAIVGTRIRVLEAHWDGLNRRSGLWSRPLIRRGFPHTARGAYGFGGLGGLLLGGLSGHAHIFT
jgi:hypothetical protein